MEYLNDLLVAQNLLRKGNQIIAVKSLENTTADLKYNGKHPTERRMGIIKDIGLKDNEIVVDFDVLVEIDADGEPTAYKLPEDEMETLPTMSAWCYLNQVVQIIENNGRHDLDMVWRIDEEPFRATDTEEV